MARAKLVFAMLLLLSVLGVWCFVLLVVGKDRQQSTWNLRQLDSAEYKAVRLIVSLVMLALCAQRVGN